MNDFLILELATRFGIPFDEIREAMTEPYPGTVQFPSLRTHLGAHFIHCATEPDASWFQFLPLHFTPKKPAILKAFDRAAEVVPEEERRFLVLFVQTPIGSFTIQRSALYDGQGGSFLHRDKSGLGYVVQPFEHWFSERTGLWSRHGDDVVLFSDR